MDVEMLGIHVCRHMPTDCTMIIAPDDVFSQTHHVFVVGIGLIELDRRELGVVTAADAFIPEDSTNLIHLPYTMMPRCT